MPKLKPRRLRSKTFTTRTKEDFKKAYKFLNSLPKSRDAWMESYKTSRGTPRAVVYYYSRSKKKAKKKRK